MSWLYRSTLRFIIISILVVSLVSAVSYQLLYSEASLNKLYEDVTAVDETIYYVYWKVSPPQIGFLIDVSRDTSGRYIKTYSGQPCWLLDDLRDLDYVVRSSPYLLFTDVSLGIVAALEYDNLDLYLGNLIFLVEGRLPESSDETLLEYYYAVENEYEIGSKIRISDRTPEEIHVYGEYEVVGLFIQILWRDKVSAIIDYGEIVRFLEEYGSPDVLTHSGFETIYPCFYMTGVLVKLGSRDDVSSLTEYVNMVFEEYTIDELYLLPDIGDTVESVSLVARVIEWGIESNRMNMIGTSIFLILLIPLMIHEWRSRMRFWIKFFIQVGGGRDSYARLVIYLSIPIAVASIATVSIYIYWYNGILLEGLLRLVDTAVERSVREFARYLALSIAGQTVDLYVAILYTLAVSALYSIVTYLMLSREV